jgi:hypothetical protein
MILFFIETLEKRLHKKITPSLQWVVSEKLKIND